MGVPVFFQHATFTVVAVVILITRSTSAQATLTTMKLQLTIIVIKKVADTAKVASEVFSALFTCFLRFLNCITWNTFDFLDSMGVQFVTLFMVENIFILLLIMTPPARVEFLTNTTLDLAKSFIVYTPYGGFVHIPCIHWVMPRFFLFGFFFLL